MAKFLNHIQLFVAVIFVVILSVGNRTAIANTDIDGKASKEAVGPEPGTKFEKAGKQQGLNADSLKSAEKIAQNAKQGSKGQSKVKKSNNASPSTFSYNFVFYLMYKFKLEDIFGISKEKNSIVVPNESSIIANSKRLINSMINRIVD